MAKAILEAVDGDILWGDDGYVIFWPSGRSGAFSAADLREIAAELDRRNEPWDAKVRAQSGD